MKIKSNTLLTVILFCIFSACAPSLSEENILAPEPISDDSQTLSDQFFIIALDIGQGDATLLITPAGKTILIDAGPPDGYTVILDTLASLHIQKIDYAIATHYDTDHIGGFVFVKAGFDQINGTADDIAFTTMLDRGGTALESKIAYDLYATIFAGHREALLPGSIIETGDGVKLECLIIDHKSVDEELPIENDDENSRSMGLVISFGSFRYLTTGDLPGGGLDTDDLESTVGKLAGPADVLHVGHHGSKTSTSQNLLDEVNPQVALISVGDSNRYGHPAPEVLFRLDQAGAEIYQTESGQGGQLPAAHIAHGNINIVVYPDDQFEVDGDLYQTARIKEETVPGAGIEPARPFRTSEF